MIKRTFWLFCVGGVAGFAVDAAVLYLTAPLLGWYAARVVSFLCAATATWWFNRRITFTDAQRTTRVTDTLRQYAKYLSSMTVGGAVNYLTYVVALRWLDGPLAPLLGVALGSGAGLVLNFSMARWLIFKASQSER